MIAEGFDVEDLGCGPRRQRSIAAQESELPVHPRSVGGGSGAGAVGERVVVAEIMGIRLPKTVDVAVMDPEHGIQADGLEDRHRAADVHVHGAMRRGVE